MMRVEKGVHPEQVRQDGSHVLFVEGSGADSLDPTILRELFDGRIRVEPLGASFNVKSVAESLHPSHPSYYFLIDRDYHIDEDINRCWENFPDPETHNLLIWRYREIENYFLDPGYLACSDFLEVSKEDLANKIKQACQERLYLDTANHVVITIREELKKNWIKKFTDPAGFKTRDQAVDKLRAAREFQTFEKDVAGKIDLKEVERRFDKILYTMTQGANTLEFGKGKWLEMIQGKKVLSRLIHSACFKVVDLDGNSLQGQEKVNQVVKNLLKKDISKQPNDFRELKRLIEDRFTS